MEKYLLFFFGWGVPEVLLVVFIILLFFGRKLLPSLGRGLGNSIREIKNLINESKSEKKPKD